MTNQQHGAAQAVGVPARDPVAAQVQEGWEHRRAGLPFPRAYETWPKDRQSNYESGRRLAAALAPHTRQIPAWYAHRLFPVKTATASVANALNVEQALTLR